MTATSDDASTANGLAQANHGASVLITGAHETSHTCTAVLLSLTHPSVLAKFSAIQLVS